MMTIASRIIAKVKGIFLKCIAGLFAWQNRADTRHTSPVYRIEDLIVTQPELLFIKELLEAERQRIWEATYYPLTQMLKIEDVTKQYQQVIAEQPDSPEAMCFRLLDRIGRLEYRESQKEKKA